MAKLQASWVHGTSVKVEREGYYISKRITGYAAQFNTHGEEWFHFAIPTPVIVDNNRTTLSKVFLLFKTNYGAKIQHLHVYDGASKITTFEDLSLSGDYSDIIEDKNMWVINPQPSIKYGVGLSFFVNFGERNVNNVPHISFVTAGADFISP